MNHVFHVVTAFDFQIPERSVILSQNIADVTQAVTRTQSTLTGLKQQVVELISTLEDAFYRESYRVYDTEMCHNKPEYILQRKLDLDQNSREVLASRMKLFTDWRIPGMLLRPGRESFISSLVPLDPLYIVDEHQDLLDPCLESFPVEYKRRVRPYVIQERLNNKILEQLPEHQFGFVLAYNFFNYKPMEIIKRYLDELFNKLRPGGTIIMTFNDCDRAHGVALAEKNFMCYTPGNTICQYAESLGYQLMHRHTGLGDLNWLELKRPGEITSIRGGQTLAKIIAYSK
jgi:hypothetical protein